MIDRHKRLASLLMILASSASIQAADITWDGSESSDWNNGLNWDNDTGPIAGDVTIIHSGSVDYSEGVSPNFRSIRLLGGTMSLSGGQFTSTFNSGWDCLVNGTFLHTGGIAEFNELEVGSYTGTTGFYQLDGGDLTIARGLNNHSLYLGGNHDTSPGGSGTFQVSAGSMKTRTGVKLGDTAVAGTGTFSVVGSAATSIGIGSHSDIDGWWQQNAGSTLKVGTDFGGLTKIFIDDADGVAGGTYATFASGSLLDVSHYNTGQAGTWTVMEVENGSITDNGLAFAPNVNTGLWTKKIVTSGNNTLLTVTSSGTGVISGTIIWDGSESTDWRNGKNWSNNTGPYSTSDIAQINSGTVVYSAGTGANMNALRLLGGTLTISGGTMAANKNSNRDSHVNGILYQTGGLLDVNELEVGRTAGTTGLYALSGGTLKIGRAMNGYSLFLGGSNVPSDAGVGTFEISGGSIITSSGVKLGDATHGGSGTFTVLGSAASQIGIGSSSTTNDATWVQNSGSTLKVRIDYTGLTKIFIADGTSTTGTSAKFASGSLLDVGYHLTDYGGGTWTVMEVQNGDILNENGGPLGVNDLIFAPGVDTSVWSFSVDNSGDNGLLKVTAIGPPSGIQLHVGNIKKQKMRYGIDYERLWYWSDNLSSAEKDLVAKWSVADCDVDYVRVAINCGYELTEGIYDLSAYTDKIIPMMQDMKDANPDIKFFASPRPLNEAVSNAKWQPYPIWVTGAPSYTSSAFNFSPTKCSEYLIRYLLLMKSYGFKISFMDMTNEWNYVDPGDVATISAAFDTYVANPPADPSLVLVAGDIPQLIAPSAWSYSQGKSWLASVYNTSRRNALDIASCHNTDKTGTAQDFADQVVAKCNPGTEIWNTELHGWKSTSGADEVLSSAYMFEAIRAGFSGLSGWLAIGTTNQGHCYILNPSGTPSRNVKYFMFKKLTTTSNDGYALDVNQPTEFAAEAGSDEADAATSTAALIRGNLMTVWVLNHSNDALPVIITPTGRTISNHPVRSTRWNTSLAVEGVSENLTALTSTTVYATVEANTAYCFEILLDPAGPTLTKIEAEDFNAKSGMSTETCTDVGTGLNLAYIQNGNWARFDNIAPGTGSLARFRVARPPGTPNGKIEVRLDSPTGTLMGQTHVRETDGWQTWDTIELQLDPVVGTHSIYLVFVETDSATGNPMFNLNWWSLTLPQSPVLFSAPANASQIALNWSALSDATGYTLKRSTTNGGPYSPFSSGISGTSETDSGLTAGTRYYYVACATYDGGVESADGPQASAVPSDPIHLEDVTISSSVMMDDGSGGKNMALSVDHSGAGQFYQVVASADLSNPTWVAEGPVMLGNGGPLLFEIPVNPLLPRRFYKIKVWRE